MYTQKVLLFLGVMVPVRQWETRTHVIFCSPLLLTLVEKQRTCDTTVFTLV